MSQLFREKALKKAQSPEQLDEIIEVNKPYLWIVLVAAILLLGGFFAWAFLGTIPEKIDVKVIVKNQKGVIYFDSEKKEGIKVGTVVKINGKEFNVDAVNDIPISKDEVESQINDRYTFEKINAAAWCIVVSLDTNEITDGIYDAKITISQTEAKSFVFN